MRGLKVEIDVEIREELGDWIRIVLALLQSNEEDRMQKRALKSKHKKRSYQIDYLYQVFEAVFLLALARNDRNGNVAEKMRTDDLNCAQIWLLIEEHLDELVAAFWKIEKDEQRPMKQPCSMLQQLLLRVEWIRLDVCAQL